MRANLFVFLLVSSSILTSVLFLSSCDKVADNSDTQNDNIQSSSYSAGQKFAWMLGHVSHRDVKVWVTTPKASKLELRLWSDSLDGPEPLRFYSESTGEYVNTCKVNAGMLLPGTLYKAQLYSNGLQKAEFEFRTQKDWAYKETPPAFSMAVGSCVFINEAKYDRPGEPYGGNYEIFESIAAANPDLMLWLGDNTYLREADVSSEGGIYHRYEHTRACPEMQNLLHTCPNYAIWDDHDFGPNDSDRSFILKESALEVFENFWANPKSHPSLPGISTSFIYNDVEVFLLDNRWNRSPNNQIGGEKTVLGQAQIDWLIDALINSRANFKLIAMGGQFLNSAAIWETYENLAPLERKQILNRIEAQGIQNIVWLTGDRHHSAISQLELSNGIKLYDVTASPLSSKSHEMKEENANLIEGSVIEARNFAMLNFSGEFGERQLEVVYHSIEGEELYRYTINQQKPENLIDGTD